MKASTENNSSLRSRVRVNERDSKKIVSSAENSAIVPDKVDHDDGDTDRNYGFRVYPERWLMLLYLSLLNLLSDWAGLSVAPIATLISHVYSESGSQQDHEQQSQSYIQPEALVTVFLIASSIGTALEPWILSRLGLRQTIVLGAFANMLGSLIKSGGLPPISFLSVPSLQTGLYGTYALYVGFFCVGFANPLFQCTPALLSASWFREEERTLATSIALNSNQLGVGCAFIVGALWVREPSQVTTYFSLLSLFSVAVFVGCVLQLEDAPPTPPSGSSRVMRGSLEVSVRDLIERASSSLLVGGSYDITEVCAKNSLTYSRPIKSATGKNGEGSSAVEASTKSLLSQHVHSSPAKHEYRRPQTHEQWSPSILVASYSIDEYAYLDEGAEPTVTQTPHHLAIDIRDDQIYLAAKACFARKGFSHVLVVFTMSGVVINTLSTYLDYLVRMSYYYEENEMTTESNLGISSLSASAYVAIIGGVFQIIIMLSSIVVGSITDKTRSYFIVTLILLFLGAFALAECGVSLDEDRGGDVRWSLLVVSGLLGPLLPVATELGVEIAHPLSENTVLVILQLSCNLVSAIFIPIFQFVRDVGVVERKSDENLVTDDGAAMVLGSGRPQYTFSFFLLILLCAMSTVYFATFDGKYLRLEAEEAKKRGIDPKPPILV